MSAARVRAVGYRFDANDSGCLPGSIIKLLRNVHFGEWRTFLEGVGDELCLVCLVAAGVHHSDDEGLDFAEEFYIVFVSVCVPL